MEKSSRRSHQGIIVAKLGSKGNPIKSKKRDIFVVGSAY